MSYLHSFFAVYDYVRNTVYASREVLAFSDKNSVFSDVTRKLVKGLDENV